MRRLDDVREDFRRLNITWKIIFRDGEEWKTNVELAKIPTEFQSYQ